MRTERDVIQYIIVPPFERRSKVIAAKERLEHYLADRFRAYTFRVAAFAPVGEEDSFQVLPVMNFVDDEGKLQMCAKPKSWVIGEIAAACEEFDQCGRRSFAA